MQVITPVEINDSNMTSTVFEPDVGAGEVEWDGNRDNFFPASIFPKGVTAIGDRVYSVVDDGGSFFVYIYEYDGTFVSSFPVPVDSFGITTGGTYLYIAVRNSTTTATIYKYTTGGTLSASQSVTFSQAATVNSRAICFKNGVVYIHSQESGVHSTVTAFAFSGGAIVAEYDVSAVNDSMLAITNFGTGFYVNSLFKVYSTDANFSSFSFEAVPSIDNGQIFGLFYDGDIFWSHAVGDSGNVIGFLSTAWEGNGLYLSGEQVIKTSSHKLYQAALTTHDDPEIGVALTPPSWVEVSATNKYRAFDYVTNLQSVDSSPFVITLTPSTLFSAIAIFNLTGATAANVIVTDPTAGIVYNDDIDLVDPIGVVNMWQYFVYERTLVDKIIIDDLPPYKDATITVTLTGDASIGVGELVYGRGRIIGTMVAGSSTDRKSFSQIKTDSFGNQVVTERPSATYTSYQVSLPVRTAEYVERVLKEVLDTPTLYIGEGVDGVKLADLGYYERSPLIRSNPSISEINIKVRGLV